MLSGHKVLEYVRYHIFWKMLETDKVHAPLEVRRIGHSHRATTFSSKYLDIYLPPYLFASLPISLSACLFICFCSVLSFHGEKSLSAEADCVWQKSLLTFESGCLKNAQKIQATDHPYSLSTDLLSLSFARLKVESTDSGRGFM